MLRIGESGDIESVCVCLVGGFKSKLNIREVGRKNPDRHVRSSAKIKGGPT